MGTSHVASSRNPFVLPTGFTGRLAGWVMSRDDRPHREVADLLDPRPGARVCEIGFGPGQLLAVLGCRDPTVQLTGVDPSPVMLAQARRRLHAADPRVAGTADLRLGVAGRLPFADASTDHVVAVNTVAMWPDLPTALGDAHRILRPGGTLLLAWHSATAPSRLRRALARSDQWWNNLCDAVRDEFGTTTKRHDVRHLTTCLATA